MLNSAGSVFRGLLRYRRLFDGPRFFDCATRGIDRIEGQGVFFAINIVLVQQVLFLFTDASCLNG